MRSATYGGRVPFVLAIAAMAFTVIAFPLPAIAQTSPDNCYSVRAPEDSLQVLSVSNAPGTQMATGVREDIAVSVRYTLASHETAILNLMVVDQVMGGGSDIAVMTVSRGSGDADIRGSFVVPALPWTELWVHLNPPYTAVQAAGYSCQSVILSQKVGDYPIGGEGAAAPASVATSLQPSQAATPAPSRGFFVNPRPGQANVSTEGFMDPVTLSVLGILVTLLATVVQMVRGN